MTKILENYKTLVVYMDTDWRDLTEQDKKIFGIALYAITHDRLDDLHSVLQDEGYIRKERPKP